MLDAAERDGQPNVAGFIRQLEARRLARLDADAADANEIGVSESLGLSEAQLPDDWRDAWRRLGIFTASFDAPAAPGSTIAGRFMTMLSQYLRRSLLEREGHDRFKLLTILPRTTPERTLRMRRWTHSLSPMRGTM